MAIDKTRFEAKLRKAKAIKEVAERMSYYISSEEDSLNSWKSSLDEFIEQAKADERSPEDYMSDWNYERLTDNIADTQMKLDIYSKIFEYLDKV